MATKQTPEELAREIELMERANSRRRDSLKLLAKQNTTVKDLYIQMELYNAQAELYISLTEDEKDALKSLGVQIKNRVDGLGEVERATLSQVQALEDLIARQKTETDERKQRLLDMKAEAEAWGKLKQGVRGTIAAIDRFTGSNIQMLISLKGMGGELGKSAKEFEGLRSTLAVTTGYASKFNDEMYALASNKDIYLTVDESQKALGALSTRMAEFNFLSRDGRESLEKLAGTFMNLGVAPETTADALQLMTRGLGMQTEAAESAAWALRDLADATGQNLNVVISSFTQMVPQLSRYGLDMDRIFGKLTKQARSLGTEVKDIFQIEELFDTYESAMSTTGKLNAQLGIQLNAMAIMGMKHGERLEYVRGQFGAYGIEFGSLIRRERQAVAGILQTDVATAQMLLGDTIEAHSLRKKREDSLKLNKEFVDSTKKMEIAFQQMSITLEPVLTAMMKSVGSMAEVFRWLFTTGVGVVTPMVLAARTLAAALGKVASKFASISKHISGIAKFGSGVIGNVLGPLLYGATGYSEGRRQGRSTADATGRGMSIGAGALAGGLAATTWAAPALLGLSTTGVGAVPAAIATALIGATGMAGGAVLAGLGYDTLSPGPQVNDGRTLTNRSTSLVHNGKVSNVRSGEELRVGPRGSFAEQYRAMAMAGSQEVTIKDSRPIIVQLANGKVLAEAVMPDVTKAVGKKMSPLRA
jgi:hypothetical protein